MNYDETNGNQTGYYEFLHFCHIDMPYGSVDVLYLIAIVVKSYPLPSTPSIHGFSKFLIWMMNYVETDGKQPGFYEFLHFCHLGMPYQVLLLSTIT